MLETAGLDRSAPVRGDRRTLQQIALNLLSNAVKFTEPGGRIGVSLDDSDSRRITLSIADTGCGIPESHIARVTEPFTQVDNSLARRHQGSGLGLSLVKSMVELHDGRFEIESAPGVGTTLRAILPRAAAKNSGVA